MSMAEGFLVLSFETQFILEKRFIDGHFTSYLSYPSAVSRCLFGEFTLNIQMNAPNKNDMLKTFDS